MKQLFSQPESYCLQSKHTSITPSILNHGWKKGRRTTSILPYFWYLSCISFELYIHFNYYPPKAKEILDFPCLHLKGGIHGSAHASVLSRAYCFLTNQWRVGFRGNFALVNRGYAVVTAVFCVIDFFAFDSEISSLWKSGIFSGRYRHRKLQVQRRVFQNGWK